jgi:hypothetical protein
MNLKVITLIFATLLLLAGCDDLNIWHEKLTVTVNTPEGPVSGTAVHRTGFSSSGFVLYGSPDRRFLQGEAVVVELPAERGKSKYLFALLKGFSSYYQFHRKAFKAGEIRPKDFLGKPARELPVSSYPRLVMFEDITKPETVKLIEPDNLATTFGSGYEIASIAVQVTKDDVTVGKVEKALDWLGAHKGRIKPTNKKYANQLTVEEQLYKKHFSTEIHR